MQETSNNNQTDPEIQAWKPLRLLTFYRVILASLLAILFFGLRGEISFGQAHPDIYGVTLIAYLLFSLAAGFSARLRTPGYRLQAITQILSDITAITLLMFASGGPASGLGILLIIAVATGSILLTGQFAFLFAACATLMVMAEYFTSIWLSDKAHSDEFMQAGLLGLAFFASAALTSLLVRRIHESEALARQRAIDIANLASLNAHIVQQLQAGIIVIDEKSDIRLLNDAARKLLQSPDGHEGQPLADISATLQAKLLAWQQSPDNEPPLLPGDTETNGLLPHFTPIGSNGEQGTLILLEDAAAIMRQTQQIRLASLGRLTASIAHEIRNPLGAISHAAQLLGEGSGLSGQDHRLLDIIDSNTGRVNTIVENTLQLSRPVKSIPQTIRLTEWLDRFVDEFVQSGGCEASRISHHTEPGDLEVSLDPSLLHQVVWNLCQNALQHSADGEAITLKLLASRKAHDQAACLDIIDDGPGVDAGVSDRIFEPFYTTHASGTGLGLYIAREICESNRSRLEYLPGPDGGSCFRITFPEPRVLPLAALA